MSPSTTTAAGEVAPPLSPMKNKNTKSGGKRVRFPPSTSEGRPNDKSKPMRSASPPLSTVVAIIPHRDEYSAEEIEALYFSRDEYQASRNSAKASSWDCERRGLAKCLDDTFREKDADAQDKLNQWALTSSLLYPSSCAASAAAADNNSPTTGSPTCCRRGLERWSNSDHGEVRNHAQFHAIMAVLRAQDDQLSSSRRHQHNELDWDKLRKVSCRATKASRHFARMIGKADSYAVGQELKLLQQSSSSQALHMSGETSMSLANASDHTASNKPTSQDEEDADLLALCNLSVAEEHLEDDDDVKESDVPQQQQHEKGAAPNFPRGVGGRLFNFKRRKDALASRVA